MTICGRLSGRWLCVPQHAGNHILQHGRSVIPKSTKPGRIAENIDVFDFELTDDEMARIGQLDTGSTLFFNHDDVEWVSRLNGVRVD